jgi:hypothetical protein
VRNANTSCWSVLSSTDHTHRVRNRLLTLTTAADYGRHSRRSHALITTESLKPARIETSQLSSLSRWSLLTVYEAGASRES